MKNLASIFALFGGAGIYEVMVNGSAAWLLYVAGGSLAAAALCIAAHLAQRRLTGAAHDDDGSGGDGRPVSHRPNRMRGGDTSPARRAPGVPLGMR